MPLTMTKVKLGSYEFEVNPQALSKPRELMQEVTRSINGRGQGSYIPNPNDDQKILIKRQFNLNGEDFDGAQIEAIEAEIEKAPPLFFRNAEGEECQVTVDSFESSQEAQLWEGRPWSLTLNEV